jgi:hypothetical protein
MENMERDVDQAIIDVVTNEAPHLPVLTLKNTQAFFYIIQVEETCLPNDVKISLDRIFGIFIDSAFGFSKKSFTKRFDNLWIGLQQSLQKHIQILFSQINDLKPQIESLILKSHSWVDSIKMSIINDLLAKLKVSLNMRDEVSRFVFSKKNISEIDPKFLEIVFNTEVKNMREFIPIFKEYYSAFIRKNQDVDSDFGIADLEFQKKKKSEEDSCRHSILEILQKFLNSINVYWVLFKSSDISISSNLLEKSFFLEYNTLNAILSEDPQVQLTQVVEMKYGSFFVIWSESSFSSELFYLINGKFHHLDSLKDKKVVIANGSIDSGCLLYFKNTGNFSLITIESFKLHFIKDFNFQLAETERVIEICFIPEIQYAFFTTNLKVYMLDNQENFNQIGSELFFVRYLPSEKIFLFTSDSGVRMLDSTFTEIREIRTQVLIELFSLDLESENSLKLVLGFQNDMLFIMKYTGKSVNIVKIGLFFDCEKSRKSIKKSGLLLFKNNFKIFKDNLFKTVKMFGNIHAFETYDFPDVFAVYLNLNKKFEARPASLINCDQKCPLCQTKCSSVKNHLDFHDGVHLNCNQNMNCIDYCMSGIHESHKVYCAGGSNCAALFYPGQVKHEEEFDMYPCSLFWMGYRWKFDKIE